MKQKSGSELKAERQVRLEDGMIKSFAEWKGKVLIPDLCQKTVHDLS